MKYLLFVLTFFVVTIAQSQNITDLKIQGNKKLKSSFVKKVANAKAGAVLDSIQLDEDIKLLKRWRLQCVL